MTQTQTLATGASAQEAYANRYKPVGVVKKELHKPLNRCFWPAMIR